MADPRMTVGDELAQLAIAAQLRVRSNPPHGPLEPTKAVFRVLLVALTMPSLDVVDAGRSRLDVPGVETGAMLGALRAMVGKFRDEIGL